IIAINQREGEAQKREPEPATGKRKKGDTGEEERQARKAAVRPAFPEAHLDLGRVLYDLGRSDEAIEQFRVAIQQHEPFPRAHYELGRALIRAGRLSEAMDQLKLAIDQQAGVFAEAHFQMGLLLSRQGNADTALDSYQMAIKQSGGVYPEAYYYMGLDHVRTRNIEAAVAAYRKAIEQRGGYYPEAHQDLGRVLYAMGELEAANEEYSIAVRQRSANAATAGGGNGAPRGETATIKPKKQTREMTTEEIGAALRQAPAAADTGRTQELGSFTTRPEKEEK